MSGVIALLFSRIGVARPVAEGFEHVDPATFGAIAELLTSRMDEHDQTILVSFMDKLRALMTAVPSPNVPCPCGSGQKFERCCGRWPG